jgi:hypothetical protein
MGTIFFILFLLALLCFILGLINPRLVIKWGEKRSRGKVALIYGIAMIFFVALGSLTTNPSKEQGNKEVMKGISVQETSRAETKEFEQLRYTVLDREVYDAPVKTQVTLKLLVSGNITEKGLEELLIRLYSEIKKETGFEYRKNPNNIDIYAFTSKERAESGMAQWIGMLLKNVPDEEPEIRMNDRQFAHLKAAPEEKFGLSEEKRKEIWDEIVKAEDRANKEAEERYPLPDPSKPGYSQTKVRDIIIKQGELIETLTEKYMNEVTTKYGLTQEQLDAIVAEAFEKDWPFPKIK